jgi:hypothetical protein
MTLLKFGHTIVNADRIAFVSAINVTDLTGASITIGVSIVFDGGAKVDVMDPKGFDAFVGWANSAHHHIQIVL